MAIIVKNGRDELPTLTPNKFKILEAILLVIERAKNNKQQASQYDIAKTIFLADYEHLKQYGRPVTFDNPHAMNFGPVPSFVYDMLKPKFNWNNLALDAAPWKTENITGNIRIYYEPVREADRRKLSKTDISELEQAFDNVKKMGFGGTSDYTHEFDAYKQAWRARGISGAAPMDLRLLFPLLDGEDISNLVDASRHFA